MAELVAKTSGNINAAATWGVGQASQLVFNTQTIPSTVFQRGVGFTPGAVEIDGVLLFIRYNSNVTTPTQSDLVVELWNDTDSVQVAERTVAGAELPEFGQSHAELSYHSVFFKFDAAHTLIAGKTYKIGVKRVDNGIDSYIWRSSTATDWTFVLRGTTAQVPTSSDNLYIAGEYTAPTTKTVITVTQNNTGTGTFCKNVYIGAHGVLKGDQTAATAFHLKMDGTLYLTRLGKLEFGTSGARVPVDTTHVVEFDCVSSQEHNLLISGECKIYGDNLVTRDLLNADAAASATSLTTTVSTGWKSGEKVGIGSTAYGNAGADEAEEATLSVDASGTTLTVPAITNQHYGTSGATPHDTMQAELVYLFRNVTFKANASFGFKVLFGDICDVHIEYCEFQYLQGGGGEQGYSFEWYKNTTAITSHSAGVLEVEWSLFSNHISSASYLAMFNAATRTWDQKIRNNCYWDVNPTSGGAVLYCRGFNGDAAILDDMDYSGNWIVNFKGRAIVLGSNTNGDLPVPKIHDMRISSCHDHVSQVIEVYQHNIREDKFQNWNIHSCQWGIELNTDFCGHVNRFKTIKIWRCEMGFYFAGTGGPVSEVLIEDYTSFGMGSNAALWSAAGTSHWNIRLVSPNLQGKSSIAGDTISGDYAFKISTGSAQILIENGQIGNLQAHDLHAVEFNLSTVEKFPRFISRNTAWGDATFLENESLVGYGSYFGFLREDQVDDNHRAIAREANYSSDYVVYKTAAPSVKVEPKAPHTHDSPTYFAHKARVPHQDSGVRWLAHVDDGSTATIKVNVREDASYNGNRARLMLRANSAMGVNVDTVLDTATAASDEAWEELSGVTPTAIDDGWFEFFIDCDGSAGALNVDDVSIS